MLVVVPSQGGSNLVDIKMYSPRDRTLKNVAHGLRREDASGKLAGIMDKFNIPIIESVIEPDRTRFLQLVDSELIPGTIDAGGDGILYPLKVEY